MNEHALREVQRLLMAAYPIKDFDYAPMVFNVGQALAVISKALKDASVEADVSEKVWSEMRLLKFRVWHRDEKQMYTPGYFHFAPDGALFGVLVKVGALLAVDDFEVMQYTGIADKNGKNIYEGDILGLEDPNDDSRVVIVFRDAAFKAELVRYPGSYDPHWFKADSDWVVIGNIHEHPELTKLPGVPL